MAVRPLHILQVSTSDIGGGAQKVAWNLFRSYRDRGHGSWLAVGLKLTADPEILAITNRERGWVWSRFWWAVHSRLQSFDRNGRFSRLAHQVAEPRALLDHFRGVEDFHFPGTWQLLKIPPRFPDVIHCHNLHGNYFDLRALSWLSQKVPTVLTLHDAWLLSGHCAHSFDCERWKVGCGQCPDLTLYPAVRRDATAYNWQRKRVVYEQSRLYVATPSRWLMDKVEQSMLAPGVIEARVIPNGVDLTIFHPQDRRKARASLALPQEAKILLFTANGIRANPWKDYQTLRDAIGRLAERVGDQEVLFIALGEDAPPEHIGRGEIRFVPYQKSPDVVACYYQAADLYVHAARAETFPNTILEALACGAPVVATAVGGVPEQVKGLRTEISSINHYPAAEATGLLTSPGDAEELATCIEQLLKNQSLLRQLSQNAAKDARERFDLERQVDAYLDWYEEIHAAFKIGETKGYELAGA